MNPESRYRPLIQVLVEKLEKLTTRLHKLESTRQLFDVTNEISPDEFAASPVNDLDAQDADVLRITASLAVTISGIAGGRQGRFLELYNASIFTLTLAHESADSGEANRFVTPGGTSVTVTSKQRRRLYYDSTVGRWATG